MTVKKMVYQLLQLPPDAIVCLPDDEAVYYSELIGMEYIEKGKDENVVSPFHTHSSPTNVVLLHRKNQEY